MSTIKTQIQDAAPRNRELLAILLETDHAIPDLEQQKLYIADLDNQLTLVATRIKDLDQKREKEFKEHEKYRDSVMRRFAYKVGGKKEKFQEKAAKEEREYFDALREEHQAKDQQINIQNLKDEAVRRMSELEHQVSRHSAAQQDLDGLYNSIFTGVTLDFPDEDNKELQNTMALQAYQAARSMADAQGQAVNSLEEASKRLNSANLNIDEALSFSRVDMFGGGGMSDLMERNALQKAEMQVKDGLWHFQAAKRMDPLIHDLPPIKIAQGKVIADILFDNIFTDMAFHDKIKDSKMELSRCLDALNAQLQGARAKHIELDQDQKSKLQVLEQARLALQKARQQIFERTASGNNASSGPPPSYGSHAQAT